MSAALAALVARGRPVAAQAPWPRVEVDAAAWQDAGAELAAGAVSLSALWGEAACVHAALLGERTLGVLSLACPEGHFPSLAARHPPALRMERTIRDLHGLVGEGTPDPRPWLDHGAWGVHFRADAPEAPYPFLPTEGAGLHQVPVGPVHAGTIEPGHFRFTVSGETVVRLEQRLGYTHRGLLRLMQGATLERAAMLAGRACGDSTVAYALAFARAAEAALGVRVPPRAAHLRALLAELERIANHVGDFGAICNDASFALIQAHCAVLREQVLRAADAAFGHRLMRDRIAPGGVLCDLDAAGATALRKMLAALAQRLPRLVEVYDRTASLQDRTVGTGIVRTALARQYAAGGYVGRAAGRDFDARRDLAYPPYDALGLRVPVREEGDVNARVWIRIREIEESLALCRRLLEDLPEGTVRADLPVPGAAAEGLAVVEAFRGDLLCWLRLAPGATVERCHLRDASWMQWPLLEAAAEGNIIADFPLCNKSFNCAYAGVDL